MNIIECAKAAQSYYESIKPKNIASGYDKYIATDGETCVCVNQSYAPGRTESVFMCCVRNRTVVCQLYKRGDEQKEEKKEHVKMYKLTAEPNMRWSVRDVLNDIKITWKEGMYNTEQNIELPSDLQKGEDVFLVPNYLKKIAAWTGREHELLAVCDEEARASVISQIGKEEWWIHLAAVTHEHAEIIKKWHKAELDNSDVYDLDFLLQLTSVDSKVIDEGQRDELLSVLKNLENAEAKEVFSICAAYWTGRRNMYEWSRDLLWWPSCV